MLMGVEARDSVFHPWGTSGLASAAFTKTGLGHCGYIGLYEFELVARDVGQIAVAMCLAERSAFPSPVRTAERPKGLATTMPSQEAKRKTPDLKKRSHDKITDGTQPIVQKKVKHDPPLGTRAPVSSLQTTHRSEHPPTDPAKSRKDIVAATVIPETTTTARKLSKDNSRDDRKRRAIEQSRLLEKSTVTIKQLKASLKSKDDELSAMKRAAEAASNASMDPGMAGLKMLWQTGRERGLYDGNWLLGTRPMKTEESLYTREGSASEGFE